MPKYINSSSNNNGYDKIKVANGIQQRSYISFFWSGVCVFWQFCKVLKGLSNSRDLYFHLKYAVFIFSKRKLVIFFFFCNTATLAFIFFCKNKWYLKKNFLEKASIYRCWWLYLYEIVTLDMFIQRFRQYLINWYFDNTFIKTSNKLENLI